MKTLKFLSLLLIVFSLAFCVIGCSDKDDDDDCDHDWSDWKLVKDGYCDEKKWEKECDECGETKTKKGKDRDHDWTMTQYVSATCITGGYIEYECFNCSKTKTEFTGDASTNNHSFDIYGYCVYCGYESGGAVTPTPDGTVNPLAGTYYIKVWIPDQNGVEEQIQQQINDFMAANPGIIIHANISEITEADAAYMVCENVAYAPDIYCFAQDQLARLVRVGALAAPGGTIRDEIIANNDAGSVGAASINGTLYAYPMTSDNGYYLYYDKSIVKDPTSLESIIADCEKAYHNGKSNHLFRYALENGWYTASFFFGAGCHSVWEIDSLGSFIGIDDNFNSRQGLVAMKGMQKLAKSIIYDPDAYWFGNAAAIVTGIWNASAAEEHFGENLGVCKLPTFTVDGETYQLGSFSGNRLMGVKPQTDSKKAAVLQLLAHYLTSEKCQMERYETFQWGPSNLEAQSSEEVQSNIHLAALAAQNAYATPHGQIHGDWWTYAAFLVEDAKAATNDADLQYYLNEYEESLNAILNKNDE